MDSLSLGPASQLDVPEPDLSLLETANAVQDAIADRQGRPRGSNSSGDHAGSKEASHQARPCISDHPPVLKTHDRLCRSLKLSEAAASQRLASREMTDLIVWNQLF
jgi:hypothetical protein